MLPETHRFIIKHALQFRKKYFKGYKKLIIQGCVNEDNVRFSLEDFQLFGFDHFYHPDLNTGYSRFVTNAKKKGLFLFDKAFELYKEKRYDEAFYALGRSSHYLQDVASPAHTKLIIHFGEDDFEMYVDENIHRFRFMAKSRLIPPLKPEECFELLARKSHKTEYSKQNYMIKAIFRLFRNLHQPDPDKKLDKASRKIIKDSVIFTIALLNAFNRKITKHKFNERRKKFLRTIKSIPSQV